MAKKEDLYKPVKQEHFAGFNRIFRDKEIFLSNYEISKITTITTAAILLIDESANEFHLGDADYPDNYIRMKHPQDSIESNEPIVPEFIRHCNPRHHRLLFRASFKLDDGRFVPFTFLCDTGAPSHFYLSRETMTVLEKGGRIKVNDLDQAFVVIDGKAAIVEETPNTHEPGNILGVLMLERLGMVVNQDGFSFLNKLEYF